MVFWHIFWLILGTNFFDWALRASQSIAKSPKKMGSLGIGADKIAFKKCLKNLKIFEFFRLRG